MKWIVTITIALLYTVNATAQVQDPEILANSSQFSEEQEIWKEAEFILTDSVSLEEIGIYVPHALSVNNEGMITLMAWFERKIYLFDPDNLNSPMTLPSRKGRGPREYESPFDVFLSNEHIVVSDIALRKIDFWNLQSLQLQRSFVLDNKFVKPDQIAYCSDGETEMLYALSSQYGFSDNRQKEGILYVFAMVNDDLKLIKTLQRLKDPQEQHAYSITGDIICSEKGDLFYSADFSGSIRRYDPRGDLSFYRTAAGFTVEEPLFLQPNEDQTWANPDAPRVNGEIALIGEELFVARSRNIDRDVYGVDVYDAETGAYKYSFKLKNKAEDIAFTGNKMIVVEYKDEREEEHDLKIYEYVIK